MKRQPIILTTHIAQEKIEQNHKQEREEYEELKSNDFLDIEHKLLDLFNLAGCHNGNKFLVHVAGTLSLVGLFEFYEGQFIKEKLISF